MQSHQIRSSNFVILASTFCFVSLRSFLILFLLLWLLTNNLCLLAKSTSITIGEDSPSLKSIAFEHYISGDIDLALDFYEKAVERAVVDYGLHSSYVGELYFEMGALAFDNGKFSKAEVYLGHAVKQNPNSVMARVKLAELLRLREKPGQALEQIHLAITKHRISPVARGALVSWLQSHGSPAQAIRQSFILSELIKHKTSPASEKKMIPGNLQKLTSITQSQDPKTSPQPQKQPASPQSSHKQTDNRLRSAIALIKTPIQPKSTVPELDEKQVVKSLVKPKAKTVSRHAKPTSKHARMKNVQTKAASVLSAIKTSAKRIKPKVLNAGESEPQKLPDSETSSSTSFDHTSQETQLEDKEIESKSQPVNSKPELKQQTIKSLETARSKPGKRKTSLVPPPPPTVPYYGLPPFVTMPTAPAPKQESRSKPKEKAKEKPREAEDKHPTPTSPGEGDPEFILEWSGVNTRKKH